MAPFLGGVTRQDPTDLIALAVLAPAYRFSRRWFPDTIELPTAAVAVSLMSGTMAVLTISATSCLRPPAVDAFVARDDGTASARVYDETYDDAGNAKPAPQWAVSTDGGASWRPAADAPDEPPNSSSQVCSPSEGCFRVQNDRVEHADSPNGPFRVAFAFTSEQRERRTEADCDIATTHMFKSVATISRPDGDHVVVAMGSQGALHRSPDGRWTRVAVLDRKPVSLRGPSWLRDLSLVPLLLVILSPIPLLLAAPARSSARLRCSCGRGGRRRSRAVDRRRFDVLRPGLRDCRTGDRSSRALHVRRVAGIGRAP